MPETRLFVGKTAGIRQQFIIHRALTVARRRSGFRYCAVTVKKAQKPKGMTIEPDPGTYAIVLKNDARSEIRVGRLGRVSFEPGHYVYVGSAFGPGGLRARVSRHLRENKTQRWHIDYLRAVAIPVSVWFSCEPRNLEHQWARTLDELLGTPGIKGFGSSDCRCSTHLFFSATQPDFTRFSRAVGGAVEAWSCQ